MKDVLVSQTCTLSRWPTFFVKLYVWYSICTIWGV